MGRVEGLGECQLLRLDVLTPVPPLLVLLVVGRGRGLLSLVVRVPVRPVVALRPAPYHQSYLQEVLAVEVEHRVVRGPFRHHLGHGAVGHLCMARRHPPDGGTVPDATEDPQARQSTGPLLLR